MPSVVQRHGGAVTPLAGVLLLVAAAAAFSPQPVRLGVNPPVAPNGGRPWFDRQQIRNVTALLGRTAYLSCTVRALGNRTVSWVRHHDVHLLTVGEFTFTNDARFRSLHSPAGDEWTLLLKFVQHRDAGMYACQVSTSPPVSYPVYLDVVEPITELLGTPELFIDAQSTINLTCVVRNSPEPPSFIFWKHNGHVITYDSPRGGISVVTIKGDSTASYLLIQRAQMSDSGVYTCQPAGSEEKSLKVHVLQGEKPAAMQTGGSGALPSPCSVVGLALLLVLRTVLSIELLAQHSTGPAAGVHSDRTGTL